MLQIQQLAEFRTLYPEFKTPSFEDLLSGIGKDTLLRLATYLIGNNLFSDEEIDNKILVENWFSEGNQTFAQQLYDRLEDYKEKTGQDLKLVHIISCLKILQHGLELDDEGLLNTKSKEQSEIDLLFAMLVSNQNEDTNHTKDSKKIEQAFPDEYPAALLLYMQFPSSDIINFHFADYTYCQIIKSLMLFRFLESNPECAPLLKEFYSYFGINHWKEYFERVLPIITAWSKRAKASSVDIILNKDEQFKDNYNFLKKFALSDYAKMEDVDYIKIREKPLLELDDTTFRIVHPLFLSDKVYKSLYFLLNQLYSKTDKKLGSFRSWYTSNFSEGICFTEILQMAFPNADVLLFDKDFDPKKVVGPPDAYLRKKRNVFLFENKDILINASIKGAYDFDALVTEIKKKLLDENGRPVGIGQIITNIRKLLTGENKYDPAFDPEVENIYPILITHDNMFDTVGLNRVLGVFFNQELAKLKDSGSFLNQKFGRWRSQELLHHLFKESNDFA